MLTEGARSRESVDRGVLRRERQRQETRLPVGRKGAHERVRLQPDEARRAEPETDPHGEDDAAVHFEVAGDEAEVVVGAGGARDARGDDGREP